MANKKTVKKNVKSNEFSMKKRDLFILQKGLQGVGNLKGVKFVYAIAKNMRRVDAECEDVLKSLKPYEKWEAIEKKQREINERYCKKSNGEPIPNSKGGFIILPEHEKKHKSEMDELKKGNEELFVERKKQIEDYNDSLDDEIDIDFHKIKFEDIPEDITASQLGMIVEIVE